MFHYQWVMEWRSSIELDLLSKKMQRFFILTIWYWSIGRDGCISVAYKFYIHMFYIHFRVIAELRCCDICEIVQNTPSYAVSPFWFADIAPAKPWKQYLKIYCVSNSWRCAKETTAWNVTVTAQIGGMKVLIRGQFIDICHQFFKDHNCGFVSKRLY